MHAIVINDYDNKHFTNTRNLGEQNKINAIPPAEQRCPNKTHARTDL